MGNKAYIPGTFCWWELATTSQEGANSFYADLFGWEVSQNPMGEGQYYTMFMVGDQDTSGAYQMGPDQAGMPPNWASYIAVSNVDDAAAKVTAAGGTVMAGPFDVMEFGRMAVIQDPTGAVVGMWQSGMHHGAGHANAVGGVCWTELMTSDAAKAGAFYSEVFGWTIAPMAMEGMEYSYLKLGEQTVGGMMQMTPEMGPIPPHWMPYFWVADCDATFAKAQELGGAAVMPPSDIPTVGRFAILKDPQGAHFSVITLTMPS
jgi:predicted enzyme related to lactoylglutathione lyase